jgi:hypothetical protein
MEKQKDPFRQVAEIIALMAAAKFEDDGRNEEEKIKEFTDMMEAFLHEWFRKIRRQDEATHFVFGLAGIKPPQE